MIGAVLAFVNPKIQEIRDKLVLDKTVEMLEELDSKISEVGSVVGNQRVINLDVKRGELKIGDTEIEYVLEGAKVEYSQATTEDDFIDSGEKVKFRTEKNNDLYDVTLKLDYKGEYILDYGEGALTKSSTAYKLSIINKGGTPPKIQINLI